MIAAAPSLDGAILTAKLGVAAAAIKVAADAFYGLPDAARFLAIWGGLAAAVLLLPRVAGALGKRAQAAQQAQQQQPGAGSAAAAAADAGVDEGEGDMRS